LFQKIEESSKTFIVPGALFEEMGFTYVGSLEGHHLSYLIKNFENIKDLTGPVLVHVITKKGKGYRFAEENPLSYHGVAPLMWKQVLLFLHHPIFQHIRNLRPDHC